MIFPLQGKKRRPQRIGKKKREKKSTKEAKGRTKNVQVTRTKNVQVTRTKNVQVTRTKNVQVTRNKMMPPKITAATSSPWLKTTSGQVTRKGTKDKKRYKTGVAKDQVFVWRKKRRGNECQLIYVVKVQDIQEGDRGPSRDGLKDGLIDLLVKVAGVVDQNSVSLDDAGEVWPVEALPAGARMGVRVPMMEIASAGIGMGMHRSAHQLSCLCLLDFKSSGVIMLMTYSGNDAAWDK
jgi:hypothetical protein